MTETSQHYHRPLEPLGQPDDINILQPNPQRFGKFAAEPRAELPEGLRGQLVPNPRSGVEGEGYQPLFVIENIPAAY